MRLSCTPLRLGLVAACLAVMSFASDLQAAGFGARGGFAVGGGVAFRGRVKGFLPAAQPAGFAFNGRVRGFLPAAAPSFGFVRPVPVAVPRPVAVGVGVGYHVNPVALPRPVSYAPVAVARPVSYAAALPRPVALPTRSYYAAPPPVALPTASYRLSLPLSVAVGEPAVEYEDPAALSAPLPTPCATGTCNTAGVGFRRY